MRVIFHYAAGDRLKDRLLTLKSQGLDIAVIPPDDEAGFLAAIGTCDVLWHVLKPVTRNVIEKAPALRLIQKMGAGLDTIDLEAARQRGIAVCNLPGTNAQAVAELALGLMLSVLRKIPQFNGEIRKGKGWSWPIERQGCLGEIHGLTIGLVGYGATAGKLAPILHALGAKVLYTARHKVKAGVAEYVSLENLTAQSDIVSLHLPLNDTTRGMFDRSRIARMKPGAILINTARGGLVDQDALADAVRAGHLAGAGLDTFAAEPVDPSHPLFSLESVVATPHIAWLTVGTFDRSFNLMAENCRRLAASESLLHQVV